MNNISKNQQAYNNATLSAYKSSKKVKEYIMRITAGTTRGIPNLFLRYRGATEYGEKGFKRTVIVSGSLNTKLFGLTDFLFYNPENKQVLLIDQSDIGHNLEKLIIDFTPNSMFGNPSFMIRCLECINNKQILSKITTVRVSGEPLTGTMELFIKNKLPNAQITTGYGSAETGTISAPSCKYLKKNFYHPRENVTIEIVDTDNEGIGDILVNKKFTYSINLNRYPTGDVGRFITQKCKCGSQVTFELLGRKNFDFIKLAGAILRREEFDRVINSIDQYVRDYRVTARENLSTGKLIGKITIEIIPTKLFKDKKIKPKIFLEQYISSKIFLTPTRTLDDLINAKLFLPLEIKLVKRLSLQDKNTKLKKI